METTASQAVRDYYLAQRLIAAAEQYERRVLAHWATDPAYADELYGLSLERRAEATRLAPEA